MKKFLLKVLLFFALVVLMDFAFGFVFSWLRGHAKGGSTANCEYIANRCEDDIIILGSSRATHHYVPQIIEDSLGLSCYNCGEEGNGIVLAYGRFKMLTNRYKPKLIIYEITPGYDFEAIESNAKYLGYLRPFYYKREIKTLFEVFDDKLSLVKMQSKMYQNTSKLMPNLVDNILFRDNKKGYAPLYGTINLENYKMIENEEQIIDSLKLLYVETIIVEAKDNSIPVLFIISPTYGTDGDVCCYMPAIDLCNKHNVPCYNFMNYETIANNSIYFNDGFHLNQEGSIAYTQMIVKEVLCNYFNQK